MSRSSAVRWSRGNLSDRLFRFRLLAIPAADAFASKSAAGTSSGSPDVAPTTFLRSDSALGLDRQGPLGDSLRDEALRDHLGFAA